MKMSDVFKVPFIYAGTHFEDRGGNRLQLDNFDKSQAAVFAINSHDALVELNKELVEAVRELEGIALALCGEGYNYSLTASEATRLLTKAKELLKE